MADIAVCLLQHEPYYCLLKEAGGGKVGGRGGGLHVKPASEKSAIF